MNEQLQLQGTRSSTQTALGTKILEPAHKDQSDSIKGLSEKESGSASCTKGPVKWATKATPSAPGVTPLARCYIIYALLERSWLHELLGNGQRRGLFSGKLVVVVGVYLTLARKSRVCFYLDKMNSVLQNRLVQVYETMLS